MLGESSQQLSIQESEFLETGSAELYELISASIEGRLSRVSQMLNQGMNVNQRDEAGRTALMEASAFGRFGVVVRLINAGADINLRDNQGITSLMLATLEGRERVVKLLIDKKADVNAQDGEGITALMWQVMRAEPKLPESFLIIRQTLTDKATVEAVR